MQGNIISSLRLLCLLCSYSLIAVYQLLFTCYLHTLMRVNRKLSYRYTFYTLRLSFSYIPVSSHPYTPASSKAYIFVSSYPCTPAILCTIYALVLVMLIILHIFLETNITCNKESNPTSHEWHLAQGCATNSTPLINLHHTR